MSPGFTPSLCRLDLCGTFYYKAYIIPLFAVRRSFLPLYESSGAIAIRPYNCFRSDDFWPVFCDSNKNATLLDVRRKRIGVSPQLPIWRNWQRQIRRIVRWRGNCLSQRTRTTRMLSDHRFSSVDSVRWLVQNDKKRLLGGIRQVIYLGDLMPKG